MQEVIKNRTPIHVDLAPNRDELYSGICLKSNNEIFILVCFNEDTKEFDGFAIIRDYEIEKFRKWDKEELDEIKNNNSSDFVNRLPLKKMNSFYDCLLELANNLIAIFISSDDNSYFVGLIKKISKIEVELKLMNEDGKWLGNQIIKIDEITYIGFDTSYEKELMNKNIT